jgi:glycosyltransferase involved in cell wall biosynthesis
MTSKRVEHAKSTRPNVVFFSRRYHSVYGAQANLVRLARYLEANANVKCTFLTTSDDKLNEYCRKNGVESYVLTAPGILNLMGGSARTLSIPKKLWALVCLLKYNVDVVRFARQHRVDLVMASDPHSLLFVFLVRLFSGARVVSYIQGDQTPFLVRFVNALLAERILVIADAIEEEYRSLPIIRPRVDRLYSGFEMPASLPTVRDKRRFCHTHRLDDSSLIIGMVGSITQRKGADTLVRAAPQVIRELPQVVFAIIGDVPTGHESFECDLKRDIRELGLEKNFVFTGFLARPAEIYGPLDLMVLPSRSEGLPSVLIEALSYGVPVVATDIAGAKEIVCAPLLGRLVPVDDDESLSRAIIERLRNETFPEERSLRREYVARKFSLHENARSFLGMFFPEWVGNLKPIPSMLEPIHA